MATIKANGGAASVWVSSGGALRIVVCRNGKILTAPQALTCRDYKHPQSPWLRELVGKPQAEQELRLRNAGCTPAKGAAQVVASTRTAAFVHESAKRRDALRRRAGL